MFLGAHPWKLKVRLAMPGWRHVWRLLTHHTPPSASDSSEYYSTRSVVFVRV